MKPEQRPGEAERIGGEVSEIVEAIRGKAPTPETKWQEGIAKNPWALIGLSSLLLLSVGTLYGQNSGRDAREHVEFRQGIEDLRKWLGVVDHKVDAQAYMLAEYGDDSRRALLIMEDMRRDQLNVLRAAADARGDDRAVAKYDKKLKALPSGNTGGQ